jgi:hypothetical protein
VCLVATTAALKVDSLVEMMAEMMVE